MIVAIILERMGWDYETYLNQPTWLIEALLSKWELDAREAKKSAVQ